MSGRLSPGAIILSEAKDLLFLCQGTASAVPYEYEVTSGYSP